MDDLTNLKCGHWLVLKDTGKRNARREKVWLCQCDCGTIRELKRNILLNEDKPRSCGCIRKFNAFKQFEAKFEKAEGCWNWKGILNQGGYGKFGANETAPRRSYLYYKGKIPKGMQVCHTCDNRKCVNPDHLFLGSIRDNQMDKVKKGRQAKGSSIWSSVLTEEIVLKIRQQRLTGKMYEEIATEMGLDWDLIRKVCKNAIWRHVPLGNLSRNMKQIRKPAQGSQTGTAKLDEEKVLQIKKMLFDGIKGKDIAKKFGVDASTICDINRGRCWKRVTFDLHSTT